MYTPKQVSEMLSIPESSLRRLSREFSEFLSKQKSRHRKYNEQDIAVMKRIREMTGQGETLETIRQQLSLVEEKPDTAPADSLALVPTIAGELERIDTQYHQILSELEQLKTDHQTDRERLQRLEEWLSLPWWKRLFTKPPK